MSAIFEIENLRVAYNGDAVLHGVTVSLGQGAIVGIVGESGSGKTTLLRASLGMLGQAGQVCGGSIRFAGKDVSGMSQAEHLPASARWRRWCRKTRSGPSAPFAR